MNTTSFRHGSNRAFSLLELSVVLAVIGLLIGGIVAGQNVIRAAELRSVVTDASNYITAATNFRNQYRYLPGDIPNAAVYWSGATAGNADGQITGAERFQFWSQLSSAGLIERGGLTGAQGGGGANDFVIGGNVPPSRVTLTGFAAEYTNVTASSTTSYQVNLGNALTLGRSAGSNAGVPISAAFNPLDAFTIDTKADDGIPGTGRWIANLTGGGNFGTATSCSTDASSSTYTGIYRSTITSDACSFYIMSGF